MLASLMRRLALAALPLALAWTTAPAHLLAQTAPAYIYGDSFTVGVGATSARASWPRRWAALTGLPAEPLALGGTTLLESVGRMYRRAVAPTDLTLVLLGYNDMRLDGVAAGVQDVVGGSLLAALVWAALRTDAILPATGMRRTGAWVAGGQHLALQTSQEGASLSATVDGSVLYLGYYRQVARAGWFTVRVDGTTYGPFSCQATLRTARAPTWPSALRLGPFAATQHHVAISAHGGPVTIDWLGSNLARGPRVILGNVPRMVPAAYRLFPPYNQGSDLAVADFDRLYGDTVAQLRRDGLRVGLADVAAALQLPGDLARDDVHPNDRGHRAIAAAFARAYAALVTPVAGAQP